MIATWWAVVRKELVDGLRDRRTILTMLFTGIALGPIALVLMANYVGRLEERSAAKKVMVDGIERAPQLANWFARNGVTAIAPPSDYVDRIGDGSLQEAVVVVPADFTSRFDRGQTIDLLLVFDDSRTGAQPRR